MQQIPLSLIDDNPFQDRCGKVTVRSEQGSALLEMIFWTAVVLFVLICVLSGRPW